MIADIYRNNDREGELVFGLISYRNFQTFIS